MLCEKNFSMKTYLDPKIHLSSVFEFDPEDLEKLSTFIPCVIFEVSQHTSHIILSCEMMVFKQIVRLLFSNHQGALFL